MYLVDYGLLLLFHHRHRSIMRPRLMNDGLAENVIRNLVLFNPLLSSHHSSYKKQKKFKYLTLSPLASLIRYRFCEGDASISSFPLTLTQANNTVKKTNSIEKLTEF